MKKIISGFLAVTVMMSSAFTVSAKTKEEMKGYSLLYENTFDSGAAEAMSGENFEFTTPSAPSKATYDGNNGICKTGGVSNDPTLKFDFAESLTTGVYKLGFDFRVSGAGSYRNSVIAVNRADGQWKAVDIMHIVENMYSIKETVDSNGYMYDWPSTGEELDSNVHRVDIVMDLELGVANYYMDDTFVQKQTNFPTSIDNFVFYLQGDIKYFDNLKLEKFDELLMSAEVIKQNDGLYLEFTDGILDKSVLENGFVIKNIYNGEEINAAAEVINDFKVKLIPETEISDGIEYSLIFPEGLSGNLGGEIDASVLFNTAQSNAIKTIDLVHIYGEISKISDENSAELDSIRIEFTEDVLANEAVSGVTLTDKEDGSEVLIDVECEENVANLYFKDVMKGNKEYILSLGDFNEIYDEIIIKTEDGKILMYEPALVDGTVNLSFINTSEKDESYEASLSLYDGKQMADTKSIHFTVKSGAKEDVTISFTVGDIDNANIRGLVFDEDKTVSDFGLISFPEFEAEDDLASEGIVQTGDLGVKVSGFGEDFVCVDVKNGEDLIYRDYTKANENGAYTFNFELTETGDYGIYVTDTKTVGKKQDFTFVNNKDYQALAENISDMSEDEIKKILDGTHDTYKKALIGISDSDIEELNLEELAKVIKNTIEDDAITSDRDKSWGIIDCAIFVQNLNDEKTENIYKEDLNLSQLDNSKISDWYDKDYVKTTFEKDFTKRLSGRDFTSYEDYKNAILEAFILATVKNPDGSGNVEDIMREFADEIGITVSDSIKNKVWTKLAGNDLDDYKDLREAFSDAKKADTNTTGSSGGGSKKPSVGAANGIITQPVLDNNLTVQNKQAPAFSDIDGVSWAKPAIEALAKQGIISGVGDGKFAPFQNITREQFVKIAVGAFVPGAAMGENTFYDVADDSWYAPFVKKAYVKGIVKGMGDGSFGVGQNITRQDMCVMIYNAAKASGMGFDNTAESFADDSSINDYAKEAVYALKSKGAVSGMGDNSFNPYGNATRAEAAKIIYSLIK